MPILTTSEIKALVEFVPAVVALFRIRNGWKIYRPFLFFIWVGCAADLASSLSSRLYHTNSIVGNIYVLIEFIILLSFFSRFNADIRFDPFAFLFVTGVLVWIIDNLFLHTLEHVNSLYRIFYSFVIVVLSVRQLNHSFESDGVASGRALILACFCFIVYFSCKALVESFYLFHVHLSKAFYISLFGILGWVNLMVNLAYAIVILWIPTKVISSRQ